MGGQGVLCLGAGRDRGLLRQNNALVQCVQDPGPIIALRCLCPLNKMTNHIVDPFVFLGCKLPGQQSTQMKSGTLNEQTTKKSRSSSQLHLWEQHNNGIP